MGSYKILLENAAIAKTYLYLQTFFSQSFPRQTLLFYITLPLLTILFSFRTDHIYLSSIKIFYYFQKSNPPSKFDDFIHSEYSKECCTLSREFLKDELQ